MDVIREDDSGTTYPPVNWGCHMPVDNTPSGLVGEVALQSWTTRCHPRTGVKLQGTLPAWPGSTKAQLGNIYPAFPKGVMSADMVCSGKAKRYCKAPVQMLGDSARDERDYERDYGGRHPPNIFQVYSSIRLAVVEYSPPYVMIYCDFFICGSCLHSC